MKPISRSHSLSLIFLQLPLLVSSCLLSTPAGGQQQCVYVDSGGNIVKSKGVVACPTPPGPPPPGPRPPGPRPPQPRPNVTPPPHVDPAAAPLQQGELSYNQGNWEAAIAFYEQALALRPGDSDIARRIRDAKTQLQRARDAIANGNSTQQIANLSANMDNTIAAASANGHAVAEIESLSNDMDIRLARERAEATTPRSDAATTTFHVQGAVYFPALTGSTPLSGSSARVLVEHQHEIQEINRKIATTLTALARLVKNNDASNELREQAEHESEEAMRESADVALKLVIDLAAARLESMGKANGEASGDAFQEVLASDPTKPISPELEEKGRRLLKEKDQLDKAEQLHEVAEKTNDLAENMAPGEESAQQNFSAEDLYDIVTQIKVVGNLAGPAKDLIDAVYVMYEQASTSMQLLRIRSTNEQQYQAVAGLQRTLNKLRIQQRALQQQRASASGAPR